MLPNYHHPRHKIEHYNCANFEAWAIGLGIAGLAVTAAGTAYSISSSQAAIDAANSAKPKAFVPVDIPKTQAEALATDKQGYDLSDKDFAKRFPDLVKGREFNIAQSKSDLEGKTSSAVTDAEKTSGLGSISLGNTAFEQAKNLGAPILSKEQRDRSYFQRLLADNPKRQFGLTGGDVAHIAIANTASQNNYNQGVFGSRINQYNTQVQQNAQNASALVSGVGSVVNIGANLYQNSQLSDYLNAQHYAPLGGYVAPVTPAPYYPPTTTIG